MLRPAVAALAAALVAADDPDAVAAKVAQAVKLYDADRDLQARAIQAAYEKAADAARAAGDRKKLAQAEDDRKAFASFRSLPLLKPPAGVRDARGKLWAARSKVEAAYRAAVREYTRAKADDKAEAAQRALAEFRRKERWVAPDDLTADGVLSPTAEYGVPVVWRFATERPTSSAWVKPGFNDAKWDEGQGAFASYKNRFRGAEWRTRQILLRREFYLPDTAFDDLAVRIRHDDHAEVFVNGVLGAKLKGWVDHYVTVPLSKPAVAALKPGANVLAVTCVQTIGDQFIDAGIIERRAER